MGSRGIVRRGAGWLIGIALTAIGATPSVGQVTLSVYPDSVAIDATHEGRAYLLLSNPAAGPAISTLTISWLLPPGFKASVEGGNAITDLAPGRTIAQVFDVTAGPLHGREDVILRADYIDAQGHRGSATGRLRVWPRPVTPGDAMVSASLSTSLASLVDGDTAIVHVLVTNHTGTTVVVDSIVGNGPSFIRFAPTLPVTVGPRGVAVVPVTIRAADWVRPGKQTLLFTLHLTWAGVDGPEQGQVVVTREVEVGVLGESAILQVMAVPSFLLLPGFLILMTFGMLWSKLGGSAGVTEQATRPQFWVLAIPLSVGMAVAYPALGFHSYLRGYGVRDVAAVWFAAVLIGALAASGVYGVRATWRFIRKRETAKKTPTAEDLPIDVLRKLHERGVSGPQVDVASIPLDAGETGRAIVLTAGPGLVWVAPLIGYRWTTDRADQQQTEELQAAMDGSDLGILADTFDALQREKALDVYWKRTRSFVRPRQVDADKLTARNKMSVVSEED